MFDRIQWSHEIRASFCWEIFDYRFNLPISNMSLQIFYLCFCVGRFCFSRNLLISSGYSNSLRVQFFIVLSYNSFYFCRISSSVAVLICGFSNFSHLFFFFVHLAIFQFCWLFQKTSFGFIGFLYWFSIFLFGLSLL